MSAIRLIIDSNPAWQQRVRPMAAVAPVAAHDGLPVKRAIIYTLLGRRGALWHTIVPRVDLLADAVQALDSANRSQLFDRLVIAQAYTVSNQPASPWETCLCAVPATVLHAQTRPSFGDMLDRATQRQTRAGFTTLNAIAAPTPLYPAKQDASLWLIILLLVGLWSQAAPVLIGVSVLSSLEILYRCGWLDRLIPASQRQMVQTGRFYLYSLCAGLIAIPLLARFMLEMADRWRG